MTQIKYQTTKVSAERTAGEIAELLRDAGATRFENRWDEDGNLVGCRGALRTKWGELPIVLRARTETITCILIHQTRYAGSLKPVDRAVACREQAHRIAWRHLKHLVEAWIAAIQMGLAQPHELLLGFVEDHAPDGTSMSMAERFAHQHKHLLETGDE